KKYIEGDFRKQFTKTLDDIFEFANQRQQPRFDIYVSSYVPFFNADTDDCDKWSFGSTLLSTGKPKLVKELRKVMNDMIEAFNNIQADVIKNYNAPDLLGRHVH